MQQLKQQLKSCESHSLQQAAGQPDVDTKMQLVPVLGQDRQQLPAAMAGIVLHFSFLCQHGNKQNLVHAGDLPTCIIGVLSVSCCRCFPL